MKRSKKPATKPATTPKEQPARSTHPACFLLGAAVIIRTVTHYYTGRVESFADGWIVLRDAAWIADTGRWAGALKTGVLNEIEPYPSICVVNAGAIADIAPWPHALPLETKP